MTALVTSNMGVVLARKLTQFGFDPDKFSVAGIPDVALGINNKYYLLALRLIIGYTEVMEVREPITLLSAPQHGNT